jgi:two-component system, OmpR family, sensor kinase
MKLEQPSKPTGLSLKWRVSLLTTALLAIFALVLGAAVLAVVNSTLEDYQRSLLEQDLQKFMKLYSETELGAANPLTLGGVQIELFQLNGQRFSGVNLNLPKLENLETLQEARYDVLDSGTKPLRVLISPIQVKLVSNSKSQRLIVAVAADAKYIRNLALRIQTVVFLVTLVLVVLALVGGYVLAQVGLRPLVSVAREARTLNETNLHPLEYHGAKDELGALTLTINRFVERLKVAFDAQRTFLAEAAHELRTPLTGLEGYIRRALKDSSGEQKTALEDALRVSGGMTRLVADLLQLSRGEVVREVLPHVVDLTDVARNVASEFPGVKLELPVESLEVLGDPDRLTQVTRNLVSNAARATGRREGVTIRVARVLKNLELSVIDNGPGIPADVMPRIWEKFFKGPGGGAGLGLAIVAQIVHAHNGKIAVSSKPGQGATFTVTLPALDEDEG